MLPVKGSIMVIRFLIQVDYLEKTIELDLLLGSILKEFNTFKITPKTFVTFLRIERAKWLLQNKCSSVQMICNEVGFRDVSSFTRLFTQWSGMTPSAYQGYVNGQFSKTA